MKSITIITASIRSGRKSNRVSAYFRKRLQDNGYAVEDADLSEYDFPLFRERLKFLDNPPANLVDYAQKVKTADGILIISPEYNGSMPPSLKNAIDVLNAEWLGKPVALVAVSGGNFGGAQSLTSIVFPLWKMGTWLVPASFQVANVEKAFDEAGNPSDAEGTNKRADTFLEKFYWHMEANSKMKG